MMKTPRRYLFQFQNYENLNSKNVFSDPENLRLLVKFKIWLVPYGKNKFSGAR